MKERKKENSEKERKMLKKEERKKNIKKHENKKTSFTTFCCNFGKRPILITVASILQRDQDTNSRIKVIFAG